MSIKFDRKLDAFIEVRTREAGNQLQTVTNIPNFHLQKKPPKNIEPLLSYITHTQKKQYIVHRQKYIISIIQHTLDH